MKKLIIIFLAVSVCMAHSICESKEAKMRIYFRPIAVLAQYIIAHEKGYFKEEGFQDEFVSTASAQSGLDALIMGKLDLGHSPIIPPLNLELNAPGAIKIVAFGTVTKVSEEPYRFIVRADSKIRSLPDFKGKNLVVSPPLHSIKVIARLILKEFLDPQLVTIVDMPAGDMLAAVQSGGVDALLTMEPEGIMALRKGEFKEVGTGEFCRADIVNPYYSNAYMISAQFIRRHPGAEKKVYRAMGKAIKFEKENKTEARNIIGRYLKCPADIAQNMKMQATHISGDADRAALQRLADILLENGLLKGRVDTSKMLLE